jgi:hypothetical protein
MKPFCSKSHAEIIGAAWEALGERQKEVVYSSVAEGLREAKPGSPGDPAANFCDVVRASWALGFHYAMIMIENKCLVTTGPGKPGSN